MPTVSVDEKPGVQAIATTTVAPDLPPQPDRRASLGRDAEYRRLGTLSILTALDLDSGEVMAQVEERHRSREFVLLLQELDRHYPPDAIIRIVLDHHAAHTSNEGNPGVLGNTPEPLSIRSHAQTWFLAEPDRDGILSYGENISSTHPSELS